MPRLDPSPAGPSTLGREAWDRPPPPPIKGNASWLWFVPNKAGAWARPIAWIGLAVLAWLVIGYFAGWPLA